MKLDDWKASRLIYSTDAAKMTEKPQEAPVDYPPPAQQKVLVKLDRKARRGKCVTLVEGVRATPADLEQLAKQLKAACGCGGTVKDGNIEIQGEHRDKVMELLGRLGYHPKASGG